MCGALAISWPCGVEEGAGEVQPLLDVHRVGGVLQPQAHLLGDVHEQVVEHLEHHRVGLGAHRVHHVRGCTALQLERAERRRAWRRQPGSTTVVAFARR
jgi:chemotaxis signal transduction protein